MHENFVACIVTQIRPVWIGELQLGRKLQKINGRELIISPKFVSIRKVELTRCVAGTESILKSSKFYW